MNNNSNDDICPICLNTFNETSNIAITPCNHKFCFNCILDSLQTLYTCPSCRAILLETESTDNNNIQPITIREKILFLIKRIYNDGFTTKELLYIIIGILTYQNFTLHFMNNCVLFLQIMDLNIDLNEYQNEY